MKQTKYSLYRFMHSLYHTNEVNIDKAIGPATVRATGESSTVRVTCGGKKKPRRHDSDGVTYVRYSVAELVQEMKGAICNL